MSKERELLERVLDEEDDGISFELSIEIKELLAQPDINTQYLLDQVARLTVENAMFKEKWLAPPKREALSQAVDSDERASAYMNARLWDFIEIGGAFPKAYPDLRIWDHVLIYAPKRKAIEDGELEVWYSQHTWAMDKQEYMWGFRDAEKCYQITGEVE